MTVQDIKQRFGIIGSSPLLDRAIDIAKQVAPTDLTVLVNGESGSGKEVFPQIIHQLSTRKHGPYIAVNCGAIPEGTIDSELFGHEKGSFTGAHEARKGYFEMVGGGTIFLDEVAELPMSTQARLLRVLETGEFIKEDAPVTKIVATILRYAVDGRASDIHIEPTQDKVRVRFRVDGVLIKSLELPIKVHAAVIARVKILATIRLDEKRKPQDGRFSATIDGHRIDFRVSTLPTYYGEKVVMRILDPEHGVRNLESVGISPYNLEIIRRALRQPYGIILISGPTGSGKSTTLYGMLDEVDKAGRNVISLEDPVEYNIDGVSQSQVRPEIGYTFAAGLRSILRQDPDIIMVGEIRDKETAQLAIQAALTGHLVLSTIHTNNAVGVIPRLIDMGVDPYLIAPTLLVAMAQRLVRRICPDSGKETPIQGAVKMFIDAQFADLPQEFHSRIPTDSNSVLHIQPTPECPNGTRGRMAVMEAVEITPEIEALILKGGSEAEIYAVARKNGFMSMREDAVIKAMHHSIPFEEVNSLGGNFSEAESDTDISSDIAPKVDDVPKTVDNVLQVNQVEEV